VAHSCELPGIFVAGAVITGVIFGDELRSLIKIKVVARHRPCLLSRLRLRSFLLLRLDFVLSVRECSSLRLFSASLQLVRDRCLYHILVVAPKRMAEKEGGLLLLEGKAIQR